MLANVALGDLRKLESVSTLEQLLEDEAWPGSAGHPVYVRP